MIDYVHGYAKNEALRLLYQASTLAELLRNGKDKEHLKNDIKRAYILMISQ